MHIFSKQIPWTYWIGWRYLKSKKNSNFLNFITLLSIGGIALGVASMIIVLSVMDGFQSELKKRMMASNLHILIESRAEKIQDIWIPHDAIDLDKIKKNPSLQGVFEGFWSVISTEAILKVGRKVAGIQLKGISKEHLSDLKKQMKEMSVLSEGQIYVGKELAYELALVPEDHGILISPTETEGPLEGIPHFKKFQIGGIYETGLAEQELHVVFAEERMVESFLRRSGVVSHWEIKLKKFDRAHEIALVLQKMFPEFQIRDWMQLNSHLFASLRTERLCMFLLLTFIVIVASFNIVTTLTLMVFEKKKEIAILKIMGTRNKEVASIFLSEGIFIGSSGIVIGVLFASLVCFFLKRSSFISLPDIFYDRTLPVTFNPWYYVLVPLCTMLIILCTCQYPSKRAFQLKPLEGIRFD
jgi:lipoprotein-releasing system permease protein